MRGLLAILVFCFLFSISVFAQKAEKVEEFGYIPCSYFINLLPVYFQKLNEQPNSELYVIYYEGKHLEKSIWNSKKESYESIFANPKRGYAFNRAKEVLLFAREKEYASIKNRIFLINGGFRKEFSLELWVVPQNAELPKPSLTIPKSEIVFAKGKPLKVRECARIYDGL